MNATKFKGLAVETNSLKVSTVFSPDNKEVSLLFSNLQINSIGGREDILVKTRTVSFQIPLDSDHQQVNVKQYIRGHVNIEGSARAVLVIHVAGNTIIADLENLKDDNFTQSIDSQIETGTMYQLTMFLLVECDVDLPETNAFLQIDSLDIAIEGAIK
ncbi:MAG: hypothetical protein CDV28_105116 [Candidatus Electronema aureum]|uniref:Uncharacterized protein n=1 Tax=Candidatus Electronema aureum TaxID=2005002 RepID=A0A521G3S5_9BACT|nr:MAG: hypothetical protein CDV28_105116 [Candidatus Electronema aureum]